MLSAREAEFMLALAFSLAVEVGPILKFWGEEFTFEICEPLLNASLGIGDGLVVDRRSNLFQKVIQQEPGAQIPDGLGQVLFKVALNGCDGVGAGLLGEFDRHECKDLEQA